MTGKISEIIRDQESDTEMSCVSEKTLMKQKNNHGARIKYLHKQELNKDTTTQGGKRTPDSLQLGRSKRKFTWTPGRKKGKKS